MHLDILVARVAGGETEPFWDRWNRLRNEYDRAAGLRDSKPMTNSYYRWVIVAAGGFLGCMAMAPCFSLPVLAPAISGGPDGRDGRVHA